MAVGFNIPRIDEDVAAGLDDSNGTWEALKKVERSFEAQESFRYALESQWYTHILFVHGLQYANFALDQKRPFFFTQNVDPRRVRAVWNMVIRIIEDMKSTLLQNPPKRKVYSKKRDFEKNQAARFADDLLRWAEEVHDIRTLRLQLSDWLTKTGNAFLYMSWDYTKGRKWQMMDESGAPKVVKEGHPFVQVDSPMRWYFHPHARTVEESPWAIRRMAQSREWALLHFPEAREAIANAPSISTAQVWWETALLNLTPTHGGSYQGVVGEVVEEEAFIEVFEYYERPTEDNEEGRMIWALGSRNSLHTLLHDGPNPTRDIPCIHFGMLPLPGRLFSDSWLTHLIPIQKEVNRRASQTIEHANIVSASPFIYPESWQFAQTLSNQPGRTYKGPDHASWQPGFVRAPDMPNYVINAMERAMGMLDYIIAPYGPSTTSMPENVTSGIQLQLFQEQMREKVRPMIEMWEVAWNRFWKKYLVMYQVFQRVPRQISVAGKDGAWREFFFSGSDIGEDVAVEIIQGSAMPVSQTATFAMWMEMFKVGAATPGDPVVMRKLWEDLKWGDMQDTVRDYTADIERAQRNIQKAKDTMQPPPAPDEMVDDAATHIAVYQEYMKTPEYEMLDPMAQMRLRILLAIFSNIYQRQFMQQQMMAAMTGQPQTNSWDSPNPVQAADNPVLAQAQSMGPGNPMGGANPAMSQGFSRPTSASGPMGGPNGGANATGTEKKAE